MPIDSSEILNVISGMVPLYVALALGYGSVKFWHLFNSDQCSGINRFICLFILPLFTFRFTANCDLFLMNYSLIGADAVAKLLTLLVCTAWARFGRGPGANMSWCMTAFSLCMLTNLLVVGVPVIDPMYGTTGVDLVVQLSVAQSLIWFPVFLLFLEYRKAQMENAVVSPEKCDARDVESEVEEVRIEEVNEKKGDARDFKSEESRAEVEEVNEEEERRRRSSFGVVMVVGWKLAVNPNVYAVVLGVAWALAAHWFHIKMPNVMDDTVELLAKAGTGTSMFNIGIFIATQEKVLACGVGPAALGTILKFIVGPAIMAGTSYGFGLRGAVLCMAIVQAALPESIASFVYAKEYGLHATVISTAVVFGTLMSLPLLIGIYVALQYLV